jgi:hypothetical protein
VFGQSKTIHHRHLSVEKDQRISATGFLRGFERGDCGWTAVHFARFHLPVAQNLCEDQAVGFIVVNHEDRQASKSFGCDAKRLGGIGFLHTHANREMKSTTLA